MRKKQDKNFYAKVYDKYGFNPLVTVIGSQNVVDLERAFELNNDDLGYLRSLTLPSSKMNKIGLGKDNKEAL